MAKTKDPYLKDLEEMDDLEPLGEERPTQVDLSKTSVETTEELHLQAEEAPSQVKDLLQLSPDIPVPVVVVIGRKSLTVKDLLAFQNGHIVDFERAPTEAVDLVAAGQVIAKGELVEVDGKLGVRILKLLK